MLSNFFYMHRKGKGNLSGLFLFHDELVKGMSSFKECKIAVLKIARIRN